MGSECTVSAHRGQVLGGTGPLGLDITFLLVIKVINLLTLRLKYSMVFELLWLQLWELFQTCGESILRVT